MKSLQKKINKLEAIFNTVQKKRVQQTESKFREYLYLYYI